MEADTVSAVIYNTSLHQSPHSLCMLMLISVGEVSQSCSQSCGGVVLRITHNSKTTTTQLIHCLTDMSYSQPAHTLCDDDFCKEGQQQQTARVKERGNRQTISTSYKISFHSLNSFFFFCCNLTGASTNSFISPTVLIV